MVTVSIVGWLKTTPTAIGITTAGFTPIWSGSLPPGRGTQTTMFIANLKYAADSDAMCL
jgi:hypothetical protein